MHRECTHCQRPFTARDLVREESKGMEASRKALGLDGVRFLYYACPGCGYDDIFLDVHALPDESHDEFYRRRDELERAAREFRGDGVEAVLCQRTC